MQLKREVRCILVALFLIVAISPISRANADSILPVPNFFGAPARPEKIDVQKLGAIRFLSDDESPPFTTLASDGIAQGFSVELARALCAELKSSCSFQVLRFDMLLETLAKSTGEDVVIAPFAISAELRRNFELSRRYFTFPARFIARKGEDVKDLRLADLAQKTIGVRADSAHAAYLKAFFAAVKVEHFATDNELKAALIAKTIDLIFTDGVTASQWLSLKEAGQCCAFSGGAYFDPAFFGEGLALLTRKGNEPLRKALDFGLQILWDKGRYQEIYLKSFPITPH